MNGLCYTADKVMQLKQRLNGVLTALKWCFNSVKTVLIKARLLKMPTFLEKGRMLFEKR